MIWIRIFLQELGYRFSNLINQVTILANNNGARSLSRDSSIHSWVKHMEIKYYWQCQQVECGHLQFNYIPSAKNAADGADGADGLTKLLESNSFKAFRDDLIHLTINISVQNLGDNSD
jgi:hypothetical protein